MAILKTQTRTLNDYKSLKRGSILEYNDNRFIVSQTPNDNKVCLTDLELGWVTTKGTIFNKDFPSNGEIEIEAIASSLLVCLDDHHKIRVIEAK